MNEEIEKAQKEANDAKAALEKATADAAALSGRIAELEKASKDAADSAAAEKATLEKASKDALEKAAELEKALAVEKEAKELGEAIAKAAVDFKNLPATAAELGADLRAVRKADAKLADRLEDLLKKVDAFAKQSLDPKGTSTEAPKGTAMEEIAKRAAALVVAKTVKTQAEGIAKAMADDPELYRAHEAETAAARNR